MFRRLLTPSRLVMGVFFMQAVMFANWVPRIPDVQKSLELTPRGLGLFPLGMSIGSFIALAVSGPLIERLTPRRTIIVCFVLYALLLPLPGLATDFATLFAGMFALGLAFPLVDVAMNIEAARIQDAGGKRIMATCHGFWSLGSMSGALIGGFFAAAGVPTGWHLIVVGLVSLPIVVALGRALPEVSAPPRDPDAPRLPFALPTLALIGVCVFCFGTVMGEVVARNWSAVYFRDLLAATPGEVGLGYAAFSLLMAVGRFLGDWGTAKFGPVLLARVSCAIAAAGATILVLADGLGLAIFGMALLGIGLSVVYPLSVTAAAGRGDRPAALNVGALSFATFNAFLVGSPLIGFVTEAWGLRWGLATLIPIVVLSAALAGELVRRSPTARSLRPAT